MNFCFRLVCLLTASLMATHALSQDLSGWSDKTVCRLASSQQDNPQYLQEAKNRGLSCGSAVTKNTSKATTNSTKKKLARAYFFQTKRITNSSICPKKAKPTHAALIDMNQTGKS